MIAYANQEEKSVCAVSAATNPIEVGVGIRPFRIDTP